MEHLRKNVEPVYNRAEEFAASILDSFNELSFIEQIEVLSRIKELLFYKVQNEIDRGSKIVEENSDFKKNLLSIFNE